MLVGLDAILLSLLRSASIPRVFCNVRDRDTASTCKVPLRPSIDEAGLEVVRYALELLLYNSIPHLRHFPNKIQNKHSWC